MVTKELLDYITERLKIGDDKETIKNDLLKVGW
jgi:hypothetical protein